MAVQVASDLFYPAGRPAKEGGGVSDRLFELRVENARLTDQLARVEAERDHATARMRDAEARLAVMNTDPVEFMLCERYYTPPIRETA